ncbi:MAG: ABC transporter permease [Nitrospirota bacterium]
MFKKFLLLSIRNIRHRELRSWLTILGIVIGIALISSIVSLGKGLEQTVMQQLRMFGGDLITVFPGDESNPLLGILGGGSIREKEVEAVADLPGAKMVIPFDIEFVTVEFKGEEQSTLVHASPIEQSKILYTESRGLGIDTGRWPEKEESSEIVLGYRIATTLFKDIIHVGDEVRIKGKEFRISGVLNEIGSSEDDNAVYMSLDNIEKITGSKSSYMMIAVMVESTEDMEKIAEEIKYRMRQVRGSDDVTVLTPEKTENLVGDIIALIQMGVLFLGLFSIIIGGIGVMNTMYTSVLERRREIGIMKAIGATNSDVLNIFVIESGMIGVIGGIVGLMIGIGLAKLVEIFAIQSGFKLLKIYVSFEFIGVALLFAFLLGVIAGVLPARQASKLNPAEALRYE